jgi:hypothetical protein
MQVATRPFSTKVIRDIAIECEKFLKTVPEGKFWDRFNIYSSLNCNSPFKPLGEGSTRTGAMFNDDFVVKFENPYSDANRDEMDNIELLTSECADLEYFLVPCTMITVNDINVIISQKVEVLAYKFENYIGVDEFRYKNEFRNLCSCVIESMTNDAHCENVAAYGNGLVLVDVNICGGYNRRAGIPSRLEKLTKQFPNEWEAFKQHRRNELARLCG